ncbi:MAG: Gfo/Idh/MocA family oxidoreductase, partial [Oscillospiraceae bacterium]
MTNIGIIGCGAIYQNHANAIEKIEGLHLVAVCDIYPEALKTAAERYHCKSYDNYLDLIADSEIDAIHICTPHYLHNEMAIAAMLAGKDVLTEKPICIHPEDAKRMYATAQQTGRRLGVCFQNRYNETSQMAKKLLDSGELGNIIGAKAMFTWQRDEAYYNQA